MASKRRNMFYQMYTFGSLSSWSHHGVSSISGRASKCASGDGRRPREAVGRNPFSRRAQNENGTSFRNRGAVGTPSVMMRARGIHRTLGSPIKVTFPARGDSSIP
ncbi:hypothetical protein AAG570_003161 [Ranatra chinensis]|uniref:Uncharacterized protein n=1 Tax=Ranatra chinensis TaxID=642074 RepID=A0ABD0Y615_9HEMI